MHFRARVKDPEGKWYPSEWTHDQGAAARIEIDLFERRLKGGRAQNGDGKRYTIDELWQVWSVDRRLETSPGWKISQDQMYRDFIKPVLGRFKVASVRAPEIGRVLSRMQAEGYSASTRKHVYSLMNQMFGDARDYYEMIVENPVKSKFHRPAGVEAESKFWTPDQAWRFLRFTETMELTRSTMLDLAPAAHLQILAAIRVGEAQALTWANVLFESGELRICATWNGKTKELQPYPKGKVPAYVPMTPALREFLLERQKRRTSEFVAPAWHGGMMNYDTYEGALKRACRLSDLPVLTTHSLRHSATEIWIKAGASIEDIRRLLNHKAGSSSTKRYIHRTEERLQAVGLRIIPGGAVTHGSYPSGEFSAEREKEKRGSAS